MMDLPTPDDARTAFLFERLEPHIFAVTLDAEVTNLPASDGFHRWERVAEFPLGVQEIVPSAADPEPILRGLLARGYFIWEAGHMQPFGTSQ